MNNLNENWFLELAGFPQVAKNGQISLEFAVITVRLQNHLRKIPLNHKNFQKHSFVVKLESTFTTAMPNT